MLVTENRPVPSPQAITILTEKACTLRGVVCAERLWTRHLTPEDRKRLGGGFETAYRLYRSAVGMWIELHGGIGERAVIEVAHQLNLLSDNDRDWLMREIGECVDPAEARDRAIAAGHLVLSEGLREAYWNGQKIHLEWNRYAALWNFVWELTRYAKRGQPVDRDCFGEFVAKDFVAKQKSRLTGMPEFPVELGDLIQPVGRGTQQLKLPPEEIHLFECDEFGTLSEWRP